MNQNNSPLKGLATFIVDRRIFIIIIFLAAIVASFFTMGLTVVEDDLYQFLPAETETRRALDAMGTEFYTYGTAKVMVKNITEKEALEIADRLREGEGIKSVTFAADEAHYKNSNALFDVTFLGSVEEEISLTGVESVHDVVDKYNESYISTEVGVDFSALIIEKMVTVGIIVVIIVIGLLMLTSRSFAEVPILLLVFGTAAIIQTGTNFLFPSISYVSNSITLVLQLALAIDYAVILSNRFVEERRYYPSREAMIEALTKAIPEIAAGSLTTIGGLIAMSFMEFGLGADMSKVLIKSICISMLTVFLLMPGLMTMFSGAIDKTRHRRFLPKVNKLGRLAWKTRKVVPVLFLVVLGVAGYFSTNLIYAYDYGSLMPINRSEGQQANVEVWNEFGYNNMMAMLVPSGDYDVEARLLEELEENPHVTSTFGLATVDVADGHRLGDKISIDEFSELAGLDQVTATGLFALYAAHNSQYDQVEDLHNYKVPLVDLFMFLYDVVVENEQLEVADDKKELIVDYYNQLSDATRQLKGKTYSRMLIYSDYPVQSEESYELIAQIHEIAEEYYGEDVIVGGNTTCARDLQLSFQRDSIVNTILSALFVIIAIIITFRSFGLSVLLIAVIQGSIWINFAIPYFTGEDVFFLSYLIVGAIQMGANIDYAIVISNRYTTLRESHGKKYSIIAAINGALPTLLTSGSIMVAAGLLIGRLVSEATSSNIGIALGRGTLISLILVIFVLPQVLLLGDGFIRKTTYRPVKVGVPGRFADDFESLGRSEARSSGRKKK